MKTSFFLRSSRYLLGAALSLPLLSTAHAQVNGSWIATGSTSWSASSNWAGSPSPVPGGAGSTINFTSTTFNTRGVLLDGARVVGIINQSSNGSTTVQAGTGGNLTFDNGASAAQINFGGQYSQTISAPMTLNSSLNISTVADTGNTARTLSGSITAGGADAAKVITYTGASGGTGALVLSGSISDGAGNRKISIHMNAAGGHMRITGTNTFSGGVRISAGTLYFNNSLNSSVLGSGTLTLDGGNLVFSHSTPISYTFANAVKIAADTSISVQKTAASGGVTETFGALSLGGHVVTVSNLGSQSSSNNDSLVFGTTTLTGNATFSVETGGSVPMVLRLGALNGSHDLTKSGSGVMELNTAAGTYSGTTRLNGGTLRVGNNTALGSGGVVIGGAAEATLQITSTAALSNAITFSNTHADSHILKSATNSASFNTGATGGLKSDFVGGVDTSAAIRAATISTSGTLSMRFSKDSTALNDGSRVSDTFTTSWLNTGTQTFVLQLSTGVNTPGVELAWLNGTLWESATDGITGGALAGEYAMTWDAFLLANGSFNATTMLGAYGFDQSTGTGWAVVNRMGEYALISPIPEPSTFGFLGLGAGYLILRRRRSSARIE